MDGTPRSSPWDVIKKDLRTNPTRAFIIMSFWHYKMNMKAELWKVKVMILVMNK